MSFALPIKLVNQKSLIYAALLAALFMGALDIHIVATALPTIVSQFGDMQLFGWISASYILANALAMPFYGKLADMYGAKNVFIAAIVIFMTGSLGCGLAYSMQSLIVMRFIQGIGGGGLMSLCFIILAQLFEPRERAKYQGWSMAAISLAGFIGPFIGGVITEYFGWAYIFLLNLPISIGVIFVITKLGSSKQMSNNPRFDYAGSMILILLILLISFGIERLVIANDINELILFLLMLFGGMGVFVWVEKHAIEPILPLNIFTNRTLVLSLIIAVIIGFCTLGIMTYLALFLQLITGLAPAVAGLMFIASGVGILLSSILVGTLISKTGYYKYYAVIAMVLGFVVLQLMGLVTRRTELWQLALLMFAYPFSIGLQMQAFMVAVQNAAPKAQMGVATSSLTLARTLGASIGLTVNSGLIGIYLAQAQSAMGIGITNRLPNNINELTPSAILKLEPVAQNIIIGLYENAFSYMFNFASILLLCCFVLTLVLENHRLLK